MVTATKESLDSFNSTTQAKEEAGNAGRQANNNSNPEGNNQQVMKVRASVSVGKANKGTDHPSNSAQVGEEQKPNDGFLHLAIVLSPSRIEQ